MEISEILRTAAAALFFAVIFFFDRSLPAPLRRVMDQRGVISFGAGMSAAYVFVHVMPELHGAREVVRDAAPGLRLEGMSIYFLALAGFLVFYALGHHSQRGGEEAEKESRYGLQLGGFAVYVWLLGYMLVHSLEESSTSTLLFAIAIGTHLRALDFSLRQEYEERYLDHGRYILAAMAPLGWLAGQLVGLPEVAVALIVAFVSGAVVVNSAAMELPPASGGKLLPFLIGGILYGLILLPLG